MSNPYYTPTGNPPNQTRGTSTLVRNEFDSIEGGFDDVYAEILALAAAIGVAVTVSEVPVASASTTDIGNGYGPVLLITGSNPINSFGANYKGGIFLRFEGSLQINHSSALQCPGGLDITTQADDACIAVPIGDPSNGWRIMAYCRVSQGIIDDIAVKTSSTYANPSWLTSLAWSKITGKPTTLAGYGITDAPQKDGTGATGTWGINISGSAASIVAAITSSGLTMATSRILGRTTASTGAVEEIQVGGGLALAAGALSLDAASTAEMQTGTSTSKAPSVAAIRGGLIVLYASEATTSGTSKQKTGVPTWANKIRAKFTGLSTNGSSFPMVQAIVGGSPVTSGYTGSCNFNGGGGNTLSLLTTGVLLTSAWGASSIISGELEFSRFEPGSNTWTFRGNLGFSNAVGTVDVAGYIALAGALEGFNLTTVGGVDAFDAGSWAVEWM